METLERNFNINSETYLEHNQGSILELIAKIVSSFLEISY